MTIPYRQWLLERRIALDALDDQFPALFAARRGDASIIAECMLDALRDHMTDADLGCAAGLHEGAAEIAAEHFGLYDDDHEFSIPGALHDLAILMCERIDGVREGIYPRLPAQQVAEDIPDAGDAGAAPSADATKAVA